jgi:hypothetical protein
MATLATRITSTGTLFVNGSFDEITTSTHRVSTNTVYASFLDEVTYNANSGVANKNLVNYSVYNAGTWLNIFPLGAGVTTGIDAPDGSLTAVRFSCNNTTNALLRVNIPAFTPTGTDVYTVSFYARHVSGSKIGFSSDLHDAGPVLTYNYSGNLITGQWVRITYSGIATATLTSFVDVFGDSTTNNVTDYWGLQIEKSTTATIYSDTFNGISNPAFKQRVDSSGALYIAGQFDEVTSII